MYSGFSPRGNRGFSSVFSSRPTQLLVRSSMGNMAGINEAEEKRLGELYAGMSEGELAKISDDAASLTETARAALFAELDRRNLPMPEMAEKNPPVPEFRNLVTVRQFRDLTDALAAKGSLESAGIECFLRDDNMVRMDWFYSNMIGGVRLQVDPEDLEAAAAVLDAPIPEDFNVEGIGDFEQPRCPKCGSLAVGFEHLDRPLALTGLLASLPITRTLNLWVCDDCGHQWKEEQSNSEIPDNRKS